MSSTETLPASRKTPIHLVVGGYADLSEGLQNWRIWHLIGAGDLRRRYARSKLGQLWLTLSSGISILIMGLVWSVLFKTKVGELLPHLAVSIILWQFFAAIIADSAGLFTSNNHLLLSQRTPCSTIVYACVYRNLLTLLHNLVIIPFVFIAFSVPLTFRILLIVPATIVTTIAATWVIYMLAALCARYRDLSNVTTAVMQLAFYVTPVIWKPEFLERKLQWVLWLNPFTSFLAILRSPILGEEFPKTEWTIALGITISGLIVSMAFIGKYRRQLLYWL